MGQIELLFGEAQPPLPFHHHQLREVGQAGSKKIRTEVVADQMLAGWDLYADLLLLAAIADADRSAAKEHWKTALGLWDGKGFLDPAIRQSGRYATYKLALASIAADHLSAAGDLPAGLLEQPLALQAESGAELPTTTRAASESGIRPQVVSIQPPPELPRRPPSLPS